MASKCQECNKKTHILLRCHCNGLYCIIHRNSMDHKCTYTAKTMEQQNKNTLLGKLATVAKPKLDLI